MRLIDSLLIQNLTITKREREKKENTSKKEK